jgi:hypothetical protein
MPSIFALFVREVALVVVVLHPFAVARERLLPTGGDLELSICHSAKDIEMRFNVG